MGKRKGGGGKGGASKKQKGAKGKKKNQGGADWYTNDGAAGIYGGLGAKLKKGKKDEDVEYEYDLYGNKSKKAVFDKDLMNGFDDIDEEESSEEEFEEEPDAAYQGLLSSLTGNDVSLGNDERGILDRIRREQEGIEDDDDEEEDDEIDEENDDLMDHDGIAREDEEAASSDEDGEQEDEDEDDDEDEDEALEQADEKENANANENQGSFFEERFVKNYGHNDENLDELVEDADDEATIPKRQKSKIKVGKVKLSCNVIESETSPAAPQATELLSTKFKAHEVNKEGEDKLAAAHEIKPRLARSWLAYAERRNRICSKRLGEDHIPARNEFGLTQLQNSLVEPMKRYMDINFCARDLSNASELRELYVLHALNHIIKSRDLVMKHNARLRILKEQERRAREAARVKSGKMDKNNKNEEDEEDEDDEEEELPFENDENFEDQIRDQGFTRPRVLIIVPTRHAALRIMRLMLEMLPPNTNIANKSRIYMEFCEEGAEDMKDVAKRVRREKATAGEAFDELFYHHEEHPVLDEDAERRGSASARPADWHDLFTGNTDECFRMGIAFNGRKSVRFFSDFYKSDIIIASPLGIRLATGQEIGDANNEDEEDEMPSDAGEDEEDANLAELGINKEEELRRAERRKERESTDFLSSIELCVVDQADMIQMQNWQHLLDTMAAVNRKPIELREDMDFARVRPYALVEGLSRRFRQTLVFSSYADPFINALTAPRSGADVNLAGQLTIRRSAYSGVLEDIELDDITHKFVRVDTASDDGDDPRLEYFENQVMPALSRQAAEHTVVVVPSYLDFVSVRKLFREAAQGLGETGERAMGKPWRRKRKNRVRTKEGKRISQTDLDGEIEQALFVSVTEYSETSQITRARGDFFHGRARILLTTERFHFYNRFRLRGIQRVVFYAPPLNAHFYSELVNLIDTSSGPASNLMLFDQRDAMTLERVVGTAAAVHMLQDSKRVFTFTSS
mmetsp:Transcript_17382/g.34138  ORF Transcript_17382/g.34138 Transcript_17382/m.34138 type:complete len:972 (+) Transcript_17382:63-2978(+)